MRHPRAQRAGRDIFFLEPWCASAAAKGGLSFLTCNNYLFCPDFQLLCLSIPSFLLFSSLSKAVSPCSCLLNNNALSLTIQIIFLVSPVDVSNQPLISHYFGDSLGATGGFFFGNIFCCGTQNFPCDS